jgi:3-oxoacyl-[acyl-carrier-protein] synthase-3
MPTTACLLQSRLGIPSTAGAVDINLGCSGFMYSLSLASGLIQTGQVRNVLILTAETYSQILHPQDRAARTIFGDAAAATLVEAVEDASEANQADSWVFGTDGTGKEHIIVRNGRARYPELDRHEPPGTDKLGNLQSPNWFYMNGPEVFNFTLRTIPKSVKSILDKSGKSAGEVDLFIFHQANRYMLEHLRRKLSIPEDRFVIHMAHCGNTVSSTIPIALRHSAVSGLLKPGQTAMLLGFGVGYSWAGAMLHWNGAFRSKS